MNQTVESWAGKDYLLNNLEQGDNVIFLPWEATSVFYKELDIQKLSGSILRIKHFVSSNGQKIYCQLEDLSGVEVYGHYRRDNLLKINLPRDLLF